MRWGGLVVVIAACSEPSPRREAPASQAPPRIDAAPAAPAMPADLEAWTYLWGDLRACLIGEVPAAEDPAEAYAAHELLHGPHRCSDEHARADERARAIGWDDVIAGLERLAASGLFDGETGEPILDASAIPALDDATAARYRAAGLTAPPAPLGPALPALAMPEPIAGTAGLALFVATTADHVIDGFLTKVTEGQGPLTATGPDAIHVGSVPARWTATVRGRKVVVGKATVMTGKGLHVAGTFGDGDARAVVVTSDDDRAWIVRSPDGGASWHAPAALGIGAVTVTGSARALDVFWDSPDGVMWQPILDGGEPRPAVLLAAGIDPSKRCSAGGALWWPAPDGGPLHHVDRDGEAHVLGHGNLRAIRACSHDALAILTWEDGFAGCSARGCLLAGAHGGEERAVDVLGPGEIVEAARWGTVLAVWEAGTARLFRVGEVNLAAVVRWGDRTYVALQDERGVAFTPLP